MYHSSKSMFKCYLTQAHIHVHRILADKLNSRLIFTQTRIGINPIQHTVHFNDNKVYT